MPADTPQKPEDMLMQPAYYATAAVGYPAYLINGTTSHLSSFIAWGHNSGESFPTTLMENALVAHNPFRDTRQFIKLEQSFLSQLEKCNHIFEGQNKYLLKEKMKMSSNAILQYSPDKVSLEITHDGSIFYKAIKNDINIYFEHFLIDEFDDNDEAIVTIYKGFEKVLNLGGTLQDVIISVNQYFATSKITVPELV